MVHVGAVEAWVDDDPLDGDNQSPNARAQHRAQAHGPLSRAGIAGVRNPLIIINSIVSLSF